MRFNPNARTHVSPELLPGNIGVTLLHLLKTAEKLRDELTYDVWLQIIPDLEAYANALDPLVMAGHDSYFSGKLNCAEFVKDRALDTASVESTVRALREIAVAPWPADDSLDIEVQSFVDRRWMIFIDAVESMT